jgi:two-component system nitrate/nitrite response regulator NarL
MSAELQALVALPQRHVLDGRGPRLTRAEREVLRLLAEGLTNPEIGACLGKQTATVKFQVASIMRKLGVHTRAAAAVWWVRRSVLSGAE